MVWCQTGNKPLSEPMMTYLLTHMCIIPHWWVNLISTKPLSASSLTYIFSRIWTKLISVKIQRFSSQKLKKSNNIKIRKFNSSCGKSYNCAFFLIRLPSCMRQRLWLSMEKIMTMWRSRNWKASVSDPRNFIGCERCSCAFNLCVIFKYVLMFPCEFGLRWIQ